MADDVAKFFETLDASLRDGTFVKLTLGNYKGDDEGLQKILVRAVELKAGTRLSITYRYKTRDVVKNHTPAEAVRLIKEILDTGFRSANLFTTSGDLILDISKKGKTRLVSAKVAKTAATPTTHNREKKRFIDPLSPWLQHLGITTLNGDIRSSQQDKWRQINKFVEIVSSLIDKSQLSEKRGLKIVDMGSGKGYLTFALYDYLSRQGLDVTMTGVETRKELVALCGDVAKIAGFNCLHFVTGDIASFNTDGVDILIALHACDTATDDALYKGIVSQAELLIAAPCCHKELRPQIKAPPMFKDVLRHGVMLERIAETLTDGLRSLLLERTGYATKLFEFVPVEHTPKNNMLVGIKRRNPLAGDKFENAIAEIKGAFGIKEHRLEVLLSREAVGPDPGQ